MDEVTFRGLSPSMPLDLGELRRDATLEGYRFIERLHEEWQSGAVRFEGPGETLIVAMADGGCAAVGGLTVDPVVEGALRVRRFYVRPAFRGNGLGRRLAGMLLEHAGGSTALLTVNAGTDAASHFWERMGFVPAKLGGITHQRLIRGKAGAVSSG